MRYCVCESVSDTACVCAYVCVLCDIVLVNVSECICVTMCVSVCACYCIV